MAVVMGFDEVGRTDTALVGGKAATLGDLTRIADVEVPDGFCVTTEAFRRVVGGLPGFGARLDALAQVEPDDAAALAELSAELRDQVATAPVPAELGAAIDARVRDLGGNGRYAVRSSATAEDLPTASFAGQQDSYLDVPGTDVLAHVRRCWASLFTERAVRYRVQNSIDHAQVAMGVVVQRMVMPRAAGTLFTADPLTSNRTIAAVEAVPGLADGLMSGRRTGEVYRVRDGAVIEHGTGAPRVLTDAQAVRLVELGRRIEAHFAAPQDIEWCLPDDGPPDRFAIVQSRPITTLFPIPDADDAERHVYVSVGHQQMMTDALKPLGLSIWQLTAKHRMAEAGGRLFVDLAPALATEAGRAGAVANLTKSDPLIGDALQTVLDRGFIAPRPDSRAGEWSPPRASEPLPTDPSLVTELIDRNAASVASLRRDILDVTGPDLVDFIRADLAELQRVLFVPRNLQMIMAGMEAAWWLDENVEAWLGEPNVSDVLTQSVPNNVTAEMGFALLDVADTVRPHPKVVAFLQRVSDENPPGAAFLDELATVPGGGAAAGAIRSYLDAYGMRCAGEIDITRERWSERPATLLPALLGHVRNERPGAGGQRFEDGRRRALERERDVLARLTALPDGTAKAAETKQMIDRLRTFAGYREYPKYSMISRYFAYKQAILRESDRLVGAGVLAARDDVFFLRLREFHDVLKTNTLDHDLVRSRRREFREQQALTPPRVLTSDGEALVGRYHRADLPPGALPGLAVSAGTVVGRARVVVDMAHADLEPGDILVTAYTDPSWTPLFVTAAALVTEVGGLMTHGAVIAREYGLPAVVGVENASRLIRDGQQIRVDGAAGFVDLLDDPRRA